jgi:hypothetical protein
MRLAILGLAGAVFVAVGVAGAQERPAPARPLPDLKQASGASRVAAVTHCRGRFEVTLADGARALVPAGRVGDRAIVVVASVDDLTHTLRRAAECREGVQ